MAPLNLRLITQIRKSAQQVLNCRSSAKYYSSRVPAASFKYDDLEIEIVAPSQRLAKPSAGNLKFGHQFSDHMLQIKWTEANGWHRPIISPIQNLSFHPAAKVFHYAIELFEGMKAYKGVDNKIRLFRPMLNMQRMNSSAQRASLPSFDGEELVKCMSKLISIDKDWVPDTDFSSLYIRPTMIGTEPSLGVASPKEALLFVVTGPVGTYFSTGVKPVSLLADPQFVRAFHGGAGYTKMGSNYAPTIAVQKHAESLGHQQVLWLFGDDHQLTEVGTMNIFVYMINKNGEKELVTPPLNGLVLPGVTRNSLLAMAREWNEFKVTERPITMAEVVNSQKENRLLEIFGAGTACVVCPVDRISYGGETLKIPTMESANPLNMRFMNSLTDIQYGKVSGSDWTVEVDISDSEQEVIAN